MIDTHEHLQRSNCFTLATALSWLGHDCPGDCPVEMTDVRATVWFMLLSSVRSTTDPNTVVDAAFTNARWSATRTRELLAAVNLCVRPDRIRVRECAADAGRPSAVALVVDAADGMSAQVAQSRR